MDPPMVDCRSLIDFCKAFEKHRAMAALAAASNSSNNTSNHHRHHHHHSLADTQPSTRHRTTSPSSSTSSRRRAKTLNPLSHPFCSHSPFAAIDAVILLLVLAAAAVLALPYLRLILHQTSHRLLPAVLDLVGEAMYNAPVAYGFGSVLAFVAGLAVWEFLCYQSRKCGNLGCLGLRRAVEFDIQIESEECVKSFRFAAGQQDVLFGPGPGTVPVQMGSDRDELEAQLRKMAPTNGRTVLICRAPCGCPAGRMEVWGAKKTKRTNR